MSVTAHPAVAPVDHCRTVLWDSLSPARPRLLEFRDSTDLTLFLEAAAQGVPLPGLGEAPEPGHRPDRAGFARDHDDADPAGDHDPAGALASVSLMVTGRCNFTCEYCMAPSPGSPPGSRMAHMPPGIARSALSWTSGVIRATGRLPRIGFSGGEPLLAWATVQECLRYIRDDPHLGRVPLIINTNASLVTREIADALAHQRVNIATSLDGVPSLSDRVRHARGRGASARVLAGWRTLLDAGCDLTGFMATFTDRNLEALDTSLLDLAQEWGFTWVRVECDVVDGGTRDPDSTADRIWRVYQEGQRRGIEVTGLWRKPAQHLCRGPGRIPTRFCGAAAGTAVAVHPDGQVTACGYSTTPLGQVTADGVDLALPGFQALVAGQMPGAIPGCRGCDLEGSCVGGCLVPRERANATGDWSAVEATCALYRGLTRRLLAQAALADLELPA